jgi:hypothetical protein
MNHREPPHLPAGVRKALHCLSLILVPALAHDSAYALPRSRPAPRSGASQHGAEPTPYLPVIGAPPLRFQALPLPPEPVVRPMTNLSSTPARATAESSVALANAAAANSTTSSSGEPNETSPPAAQSAAPASSGKTPAPILPDDSRPPVRPEDFLPFYRSTRQEDVTVLVPGAIATPAPTPIPPSSATYIQK